MTVVMVVMARLVVFVVVVIVLGQILWLVLCHVGAPLGGTEKDMCGQCVLAKRKCVEVALDRGGMLEERKTLGTAKSQKVGEKVGRVKRVVRQDTVAGGYADIGSKCLYVVYNVEEGECRCEFGDGREWNAMG